LFLRVLYFLVSFILFLYLFLFFSVFFPVFIVILNILSVKDKEKRRREIESRLFDVFIKYMNAKRR